MSISLQVLFGKGDLYFDLLEASAEEARASVGALIKVLSQPTGDVQLSDFADSRRKDKRITEEIGEHLCKTFVTPLDREDIESLSITLYKVPKTAEKFAERFLAAPPKLREVEFARHIALLQRAADTLVEMVKKLRRRPPLEEIKVLNSQLQKIEGEADELITELLRDLYGGKYDPLKAIFLKDLYELLEKVVDRFRDAGNVISHIVLKNS